MEAYSRIVPSKIIAIVLCFCLLAGSFLRPFSVLASEGGGIVDNSSVAGKIVNYLFSTVGLVKKTAGQIVKATQEDFTRLSDMVSAYLGTNKIYEDSDGNYIFSNEFTQDFYEAFSASSDYDCRVLNSFSNFNDYALSPYTDGTYVSQLEIGYRKFSKYFVCSWQSLRGAENVTTYCNFYDVSDVAFAACTSRYRITFYDSLGHQLNCSCFFLECIYNGSFTVNTSSPTYSFCDVREPQGTGQYIESDVYVSAPGTFIFSNHSLLFGKTLGDGNAYYKGQDNLQYYYDNSYSTFSSVSKDVVNNNDWETIYNNYVNNVNENYNSDMTVDDLRDLMRQYTGVIESAIDSGASDIMDRVTTSNGWLRRIYERLGVIYDLLNGGGSGSGSGSGGSGTDYSAILGSINTSLSSILQHSASMDTSIVNIYAYLDTLLDAINNLNNGTSSDGTPNITINNVAADMVAISTDGIDGFLSQTQVFMSVAKAVAPLCYLVVLSTILQGLSARPPDGYAPSWVIPFRLQKQGVIDVNEDVTVDLSGFVSVHTVLIAMECLAFIIFLVFITFRLLKIVLDIFS